MYQMIDYIRDYYFVALWRMYVNTGSLQCSETVICVTVIVSGLFHFHTLFYIESHLPDRTKH